MDAVDIAGFSVRFAATLRAKEEQDAFVGEYNFSATRPVNPPKAFRSIQEDHQASGVASGHQQVVVVLGVSCLASNLEEFPNVLFLKDEIRTRLGWLVRTDVICPGRVFLDKDSFYSHSRVSNSRFSGRASAEDQAAQYQRDEMGASHDDADCASVLFL